MSGTAHGVKLFFQIGNYFIMDSEQLVCNPFQDMQTEAMSDAQKKASMTEKLTSVKNNVCDNHFSMERGQLERKKDHVMKQLHDRASKLRYEVKLLDLDKQRHQIEVKKRVLPQRDYTYDEIQINNTEKRLGANVASFYLERKLKYPTRQKAVSEAATTPLVRQARQALKQQDVSRSADYAISERTGTAKSMSSAGRMTAASPVRPKPQRRSSRSAPLVSRSLSNYAKSDETRLPAIVDGSQGQRSRPSQVKFMFEHPLGILTNDDPMKNLKPRSKDSDENSLQSRPYTYHPGMEHSRERFNSRDNYLQEMSDDDDDPSLPDHVDLRALLFDKTDGHEEALSTKSMLHGTHVPTPILRRSQTFAPKVTQELIQHENDEVQTKVDRFLQELKDYSPGHNDSDSEMEVDVFSKGYGTQPSKAQLSANQPSKLHPTVIPKTSEEKALEEESMKQRQQIVENQTPRIPKDAWKYIKGREGDGSLRGTYTADDLVLQTITGVPISRSLTAGIPLHAACRAMRHTATFKMRKVVERLINDRTKYQQHEIEEIKKKMDQGMDIATAAASVAKEASASATNPGRPGTRIEPPPGAMSRAQSRMEPMVPMSQGVQG